MCTFKALKIINFLNTFLEYLKSDTRYKSVENYKLTIGKS